FHPRSIGDYVQGDAESKSGPVDYNQIERWTRVSPRDYDANIREMVRLQTARGGAVILVDNELWDESPYRPVLRTIAADAHVPLVDSLQIVADAKTKVEHDLETRLDLLDSRPPTPAPASSARRGERDAQSDRLTTVVFRVAHGEFPVPAAMSIVGADARLGNLTPNAVLMHDDGLDGDQRRGDGVWSYAVSFPAGTRLS